jgi:hypothetical protein
MVARDITLYAFPIGDWYIMKSTEVIYLLGEEIHEQNVIPATLIIESVLIAIGSFYFFHHTDGACENSTITGDCLMIELSYDRKRQQGRKIGQYLHS